MMRAPFPLLLAASLLVALPASGAMATGSDPAAAVVLLGSNAYSLGAVLDVRRPHAEGITVLAVTPGGAAERMGLRAGDRVLSVNGHDLTDTLQPSKVLDEALARNPGRVEIKAARQDGIVMLSGVLSGAAGDTPDPAAVAPDGSCGYVTTLGTLPHVSEKLHPVSIVDIDGGGTPVPANRHRLATGLHVVIVLEQIDVIRFDPLQRARRSSMLAREGLRAGKALVVDVQPNTRYRLGARFLDDKLDSRSIRENAYWEPLVWEEVADDCR